MSTVITAAWNSGVTLYARIMNSSGYIWNGAAFEVYTAANYGNYDVAMTEQGSSGVYVADFPSGVTSGTYEYFIHQQAGGSPAQGDYVVNTGKITWTGTTIYSTAMAGSMTGSDFYNYVLRTFKRTDKSTEVYEAISDTIRELRRLYPYAEAEQEVSTTDIISTLGDYRISLDSAFGLLMGDVILVDGTSSYTLKKVSKSTFDYLYPDSSITNPQFGRPIDYCIFGNALYIGPVPDKTSYLYRMNYSIDDNAVITSLSSVVPFTRYYRDVLKYGTLGYLYSDLQNDAEASKYLGLYREKRKDSIDREQGNKAATEMAEYRGI